MIFCEACHNWKEKHTEYYDYCFDCGELQKECDTLTHADIIDDYLYWHYRGWIDGIV